MRKQCTLLFLLLLPLLAMAQNITVPNNVYFADIHLKLSDGAQQEIQKKVDALHRNQTYFKKKVELADAYFPIIERVFKEEGVPDDFKYLALQESGLVGDAISTSNAVGYWQFKKEAASDFNLRMDNVVDERRHIIEASRGAARYFKRSNNYYDNWFNALLSYYLGYTGVKSYTTSRDVGSKKMEITERSHPYILTFLAHKIAYDNFVGKNTPVVSLREMRATPGQSLSEIALATKTDYAELERYNKWLLGNSIPSGKDYYVMVPVRNGGSDSGLLASSNESNTARRQATTGMAAAMVKRNGLNALIARPGDTKDKLALQAGISTRRFLKYNDLHSFDNIQQGAAYYIEPKNTSAEAEFHVVQPGENMQQISQHYGLKLNYLRYKNRMSRNEVPVPGRVLWLQKRRPATTVVEVRDVNKAAKGSAAAPASYSKPVASSSTPQNQPAAVTPEHKPKESIFTRFFNSLKGGRKHAETAEATPATPTHAPVKVAAPTAAKQANPITQENEQEEADTVAVQQEAIPAAEPTPSVLYPASSKATADTLMQQEEDWAVDTVNWPVKTTPATTGNAVEPAAESTATDTIFKEPAPKAATPAKPRSTPKAAAPAKAPAATARPEETAVKSQPAAKPTRHVVKQGETLYSISRMYAVTVNDITRWNNLGEEPLKMGQELLIAEPLTTPAQTEAPETSAAPAKATNGVHTVAPHETLYQISKMYNVTLEELRAWNSLSDIAIKPGQQLQVVAPAVPAKASEPAPAAKSTFSGNSTYHTVAPGESMYQISRQYGVTIKDIMEWNNKSDFAVSAGEKLLIKKK
ncbi:LysM peptidoglycan-binding domain-containing protein [Pontibacter liquoris]|uniref:LysM peptidoglycan-binding domain-containing protein n=1 Tax=Pontibacter liquoris TaxID=2905677 RepID=UPI001FA714FE|nr:LysM peptidoglycan-binding domain-containing protein [Pontibacter liquoris]